LLFCVAAVHAVLCPIQALLLIVTGVGIRRRARVARSIHRGAVAGSIRVSIGCAVNVRAAATGVHTGRARGLNARARIGRLGLIDSLVGLVLGFSDRLLGLILGLVGGLLRLLAGLLRRVLGCVGHAVGGLVQAIGVRANG